jgi:Lrp/AsnC family transcriptional regulator for asnA, asnC and gidA
VTDKYGKEATVKGSMEVKLDHLDLEILSHLEKDGRKPYTEIARATGVSIGTIHNRVQKMIAQKTLTIIGRINPFHAGLNAFALVYIAVKPPQLINDVASQIMQYPEAHFIAIIVGDYDIHIDLTCRDNAQLYEITHNRIPKIPGVVDIRVVPIMEIRQWVQPSLQLLEDYHLGTH